MREAECRNTDDPDAFFAGRGQKGRRLKAQVMCMNCPVIAQCGSYRDSIDSRFGIWGGKLSKRDESSDPGE